jgi:hypothetical protein
MKDAAGASADSAAAVAVPVFVIDSVWTVAWLVVALALQTAALRAPSGSGC